MKRKRLVKLMMGRYGWSRNEANAWARGLVAWQREREAENRRKKNDHGLFAGNYQFVEGNPKFAGKELRK